MAITETYIVSQAIQLLGHKPIITLENPDDLTLAAQQATEMLLPAILSTGNWRFAIQIQQLSQSIMQPPQGSNWNAVYNLPAGYLRNIRIIPQNYDYDIYQSSQIYCNWTSNTPYLMEYAYQVPYSQLPPLFVWYFVFEVACLLALTNAQKPEYANWLKEERTRLMALASATDASNRPNFSQVDFPVLNNRYIGGIIGNING